jgi:integrase
MTRHPKKGKWSNKELDAIPLSWDGDKLSESPGLVGSVRINAGGVAAISFRYSMRWAGKGTWFYCGSFPSVAMPVIRAARDDAAKLLKAGIDPRIKKIADKLEEREVAEAVIAREVKRKAEALTVSDVFADWIADGVKRQDNNKSLIQTFNKYILPAVGSTELRQLDHRDLLKIYKAIIESGKYATAFELSKDVKQMLAWAEKRKPWRSLMADGNPADVVDILKILPANFTKIRKRILSVDEIKRLKLALDDTSQNYSAASSKYGTERPLKKEVQHAMWICLTTLCRIGELMMAEWAHVDFDKRTWFIPKENTKKTGRKDNRTDHTVYLSDFALAQFRALKLLTGDTAWVFPARYKDGHVCVKSASKLVGDRQVKFKKRTKKLQYRVENNTLVIGDEEWTPHDLRTTGATMMQELLGAATGNIISDLCLHHQVVAGAAKHYLFAEYQAEMRDGWEKLGNYIEAVLKAENVVSIKAA